MTGVAAFEISIVDAEGGEYAESGYYSVRVTPAEEINVLAEVPEGATVTGITYELYQIHGDEAERLDVTVEEKEGVIEGISFETENFSAFVLRYTVDFHFDVVVEGAPSGDETGEETGEGDAVEYQNEYRGERSGRRGAGRHRRGERG